MTRKKKVTQQKNANKLKILKKLRTCRVVLYDIALDTNLISFYQLNLPKKKDKELKQSLSYINTFKNSASNIQLKENVQEENLTENEKYRIIKEHSENVNKKTRKKKNKSKFELSNENVQTNKDTLLNYQYEVIQPKVIAQRRRLIRNSNVESFPNKSNDETSNTSSDIFSYPKAITISISNETRCNVRNANVKKNRLSCKRKLDFDESNVTYDTNMESTKMGPDETNCSNEKNLTFIDCNSEMQKVSGDSNRQIQYNIHPIGIINETNYKLQQKQNQNSKAVSSNVDLGNKISINGTAEDIKINVSSENSYFSDNSITCNNKMNKRQDIRTRSTNYTTSLTVDNTVETNILESYSSDLKSMYPISTSKVNNVTVLLSDLKTHTEEKSASNKVNKTITKQKLLKITEDNILPQGTVKILKINEANNSLQNNVPEQNKCNSSSRNISHVDIVETTDVLREKEYIFPEINGLIDNVPKSILALNNNIKLKVENISSDRLHGKVINYRNINSLMKLRNKDNINIDVNNRTSITHRKCTLNHQEPIRLNDKVDSNEMHKTNLLQGSKQCKEINCNKDLLNVNTSNLVNCNISRGLISVNKEKIVKQDRKRIEENLKDVNTRNKKVKLNRDSWLQNNVTSIMSKRHQQSDFSSTDSIVTIDSNVISKDERHDSEENIDLREHLNKKRSKVIYKSESTFQNNFHNKTSEVFEQTDLNNKNDIIITKNNGCDKKIFVKKKSTFNGIFEEEKNVQLDSVYNNLLQSTLKETENINQIDRDIHEDTNIGNERTNNINHNKDDDDDDDDCISLFADESFDVTLCEDTFLHEEDKLDKSQNIDMPYVMSNSSFDKYIKQNTNEFNKEYAECIENSTGTLNESIETIEQYNNQQKQILHTNLLTTATSNESNETKRIYNNQWEQILYTNVPATATVTLNKSSETKKEYNNQEVQTLHTNMPITATRLTTLRTGNIEIQPDEININKIFFGYCFAKLRRNKCSKEQMCKYSHDLQNLIDAVKSKNSNLIIKIIHSAVNLNYNFFSEKIYIASLNKLTVDQILILYQTFHDLRKESSIASKKYIIHSIIRELLLNRQISLKIIVEDLVACTLPTKNLQELKNILTSAEVYIKAGEYWDTVGTSILKFQPDVYIIHKVLFDCIKNKKLLNIRDVNSSLISKLSPTLISMLDKHIMEDFKRLLIEETAEDSQSITFVQNFGESITIIETIASPDSNQSARLSQIESPRRHDVTSINETARMLETQTTQEILRKSYTLQRIDNLPDARSIYRDHENLWKFYVDLERFKKGLIHKDYDYVINILKSYSENQDESPLFFRSCRNILRTEVQRSENHLANIIRRTVQMGTFSVLSKILFDMILDTLTSLADKENWELAYWLIRSINMYDLPYNAMFFLLSAEIYLAKKKAVEAYDLLKNKNIICKNRAKWYVKSTINDEHVRNKIMCILLDSFCNEFFERAFLLFQFLLKDQSSQYFPIDLSRYVDKLIKLSLIQKDTNLVTEIGSLILKYNFALHTTTCRALVSTLVHMNEVLARQIYNHAQRIGIYSTVKLWPVTYVVINTDLTEEEIYLTFLQLLKTLLISFGHAIEFAKPHQIKAYLMLEIKSKTVPFDCVELQSRYNNKIITNRKTLIRNVLKKRFDPPILLMPSRKDRICRLQSKSLINYLKSEHCN